MGVALEPLFEKYGVALALWGHVHNYERTCPMLNQTCTDDSVITGAGAGAGAGARTRGNGGGTVHVTAGTAGVRCAFSAEIYTRGCHWIPRMFA
jgi:hypothetical protein